MMVISTIIISLLFSSASAQQKQSESYDRAISDYNKALEINPRYAKAYCNRGIAYYFKEEYEKSWKDVKKAQSLGYQIHPEFLDQLRKAREGKIEGED